MAEGYTDFLLRWYRAADFRYQPDAPYIEETGYNPTCGDRITLFLKLQASELQLLTFVPEACMLCTASASALIWHINHCGVSPAELSEHVMHSSRSGFQSGNFPEIEPSLREALQQYPARESCLMLPWQTLHQALYRTYG